MWRHRADESDNGKAGRRPPDGHGLSDRDRRDKVTYTQALSFVTQAGVIQSSTAAFRFMTTATAAARPLPISGTRRSATAMQVSRTIVVQASGPTTAMQSVTSNPRCPSSAIRPSRVQRRWSSGCGMVEPCPVRGQQHQAVVAQHAPRLPQIRVDIAHMLQHLEGDDQVGAAVCGRERAVGPDLDIVRRCQVRADVGDAARGEELRIGFGSAAEIERDLARRCNATGKLFDSCAHAAQHQPIGIPQARLQSALLLEGRARMMPRRGDACGTYPGAAVDGWVVMSVLWRCRGLARGEGRGRRDMVCQDGEVGPGGLGPAVPGEDVGVACVSGGRACAPGILGQNAVDALRRAQPSPCPDRRPRLPRPRCRSPASGSAAAVSCPQITGRPQASASCSTSGNPSPIDGSTNTSLD